ncbi:WecB/TagA/CpsF family glycosyltransferase [Microbacterium sp. 179-B 1A2 NHS]|uniref:WecB/TagA/CpsF family glycosyltransferase n=1 Tax=Microbacterium sp. 179-B 1A2 NHS TaxID=3142383 RepID=UPI0039A366E0
MAMRVATSPIRTRIGRTPWTAPVPIAPRPTSLGPPTVRIAGTDVHLTDADGARAVIASAVHTREEAPLAVVSINLDHIHHAGGLPPAAGRARWLNLIDGAPIAQEARRLTGTPWPRLAGSDLIGDILTQASAEHWSVAVLGGAPEVRHSLHHRVTAEWPGVRLVGHWTPTREELASPEASSRIAEQIRSAGADIVIVCLGKPRQEKWIADHGHETAAGVLLAFGAVVDFLAGRVSRAPRWVSDAGFEWMWRLMLEPRRLARRYLIEGPPAYMAVRRSSARQGA